MPNPDFKTDIECGEYLNKDSIASLIPYMLNGTSYALALDTTPELRKHIAAAIFKYENPTDCYEEILNMIDVEKYSDENSFSPHDMIIHMIIEHATMTSIVLEKYTTWCIEKAHGLAKILFVAGMRRIVSSFQSAAILLRHGFYVEVLPIFRMILEQLAWGCYLMQETDESKISENETQKDIRYLKNILGKDFGRLYGYLSSESHLEPNEIGKYLQESGGQLQIKGRSGEQCKEEVGTLLVLLKAYGRVVWNGMVHFGLPNEYSDYFNDWSNFDEQQIYYLQKAINGDLQFKRIRNS